MLHVSDVTNLMKHDSQLLSTFYHFIISDIYNTSDKCMQTLELHQPVGSFCDLIIIWYYGQGRLNPKVWGHRKLARHISVVKN